MDNPTHILVSYPSKKASMLFRAQDGILCGMHQKAIVVMGESPKEKTSYTFIDEPAAAKWLKEVYPARDMTAQKRDGEAVVLEERNGDPETGLWTPEDSLEMPGMGPYNPMRKFN